LLGYLSGREGVSPSTIFNITDKKLCPVNAWFIQHISYKMHPTDLEEQNNRNSINNSFESIIHSDISVSKITILCPFLLGLGYLIIMLSFSSEIFSFRSHY